MSRSRCFVVCLPQDFMFQLTVGECDLYSTDRISSELSVFKAKLEILERNDEDNLEAIAALSVKPASYPAARNTPRRRGNLSLI